MSPERNRALVGATVYRTPDEDPIRNAAILIRGGKIAAVGKRSAVEIPLRAKVLDCSGLTITAGLWNSRVHFMERQWASVEKIPAGELEVQLHSLLTRWGFTSVGMTLLFAVQETAAGAA